MSGKKRLFYVLTVITAATCLAAPAGAQTQASRLPSAAAAPGAAPCTPVARLFKHTVCKEEITLEKQHIDAIRKQYEDQGIDSDEALQTRSIEMLRDMLWEEALEHKFGKEALAPTEEEIDLYNKAFSDSIKQGHENNLRTAARLKELLADDQYSDTQKAEMKSLLAAVQQSIAFYNQREEYKGSMPAEFQDMVTEAERGMAESMMKNWKINAALYKEYGGRLAMREGTIEPPDAIGKFLAYIRHDGNLLIMDKDYKGVFRELENFSAHPKDVLPDSKAEIYKNYFTDPAWQFAIEAQQKDGGELPADN